MPCAQTANKLAGTVLSLSGMNSIKLSDRADQRSGPPGTLRHWLDRYCHIFNGLLGNFHVSISNWSTEDRPTGSSTCGRSVNSFSKRFAYVSIRQAPAAREWPDRSRRFRSVKFNCHPKDFLSRKAGVYTAFVVVVVFCLWKLSVRV